MGGLYFTRAPSLAPRSLGELLGYVGMGCVVVAGEEGGLAKAGAGDAAGGSPPLHPLQLTALVCKVQQEKSQREANEQTHKLRGSQDGFALAYSERGILLAQHRRGARRGAQHRPFVDLHPMRAPCIPGSSR